MFFSGKNGNYTENSIKDGDTFYDRTKAIGEIIDKKKYHFKKFNYWSRYKSEWHWFI